MMEEGTAPMRPFGARSVEWRGVDGGRGLARIPGVSSMYVGPLELPDFATQATSTTCLAQASMKTEGMGHIDDGNMQHDGHAEGLPSGYDNMECNEDNADKVHHRPTIPYAKGQR